MTADAPFWERAYQDPEAETFGPASDDVLSAAAALPWGSVALDLGCGDGRNALALAARGLEVDAVDVSVAGIRKLRRRAEAAGLDVRAWVQDVGTFSFARAYDLVVAHGVLHLLKRATWATVLDDARRHTRPGGWHVVVVFTDRIPPPPDLAPHTRGLFREGELLELYKDWSMEEWDSRTLEDEHPGGVRHRHAVNRIVARNPAPLE